MTFSGRRRGGPTPRGGGGGFGGGGRSGRSFRGVGSTVRTARGGGIKVGRSTVARNAVRIGPQTSGTTTVTISPVRTVSGGRTSRANITVRIAWQSTATVATTWQRSGSDAGNVSFIQSGSFNLNRRNVDADRAEGIAQNMVRDGLKQAEGIALAKANNSARSALNRVATKVADYLRLGQVSVSVALR